MFASEWTDSVWLLVQDPHTWIRIIVAWIMKRSKVCYSSHHLLDYTVCQTYSFVTPSLETEAARLSRVPIYNLFWAYISIYYHAGRRYVRLRILSVYNFYKMLKLPKPMAGHCLQISGLRIYKWNCNTWNIQHVFSIIICKCCCGITIWSSNCHSYENGLAEAEWTHHCSKEVIPKHWK